MTTSRFSANMRGLIATTGFISVLTGALAGAFTDAHASPFHPNPDGVFDFDGPALSMNSPDIVDWASAVHQYTPAGTVADGANDPSAALGVASGGRDTVSLGEGGSIVLSFSRPIVDGPSWDLAVFENGFAVGAPDNVFAELAFVEVSSDGTHFARFPNQSVNVDSVPAFGTLDPGHYRGLAGKWPGGQGTTFDLEDISSPEVDTSDIRFVRIVDIIGDGRERDSVTNRPIFDPFSTAEYPGPGFDLDAVAVLNQASPVPVPGVAGLYAVVLLALAGLGRRRRKHKTASVPRAPALRRYALPGAVLAALAGPGAASAATATFEDLIVPGGGFFAPGATTTFDDAGASFAHDVQFPPFFAGFSYSNGSDTTTAGIANQHSAIPGHGAGGSAQYAFAFTDDFAGPARVEFAGPTAVHGAFVTNTTYAFLAMRDGDDGLSPPFVSGPFTDGDFFRLTITGLDATGAPGGSVVVSLAEDSNVLDVWHSVDLEVLGTVHALEFTLTSSDVGAFGSNTPGYFALDDLRFSPVPVPGALALGLGALTWLVGWRALGRADRVTASRGMR